MIGCVGTIAPLIAISMCSPGLAQIFPPPEPFYGTEPGLPRPWHAGLNVAPWCTVNVVGTNMVTAIPVTSWPGVGPSMQLVLYYNSYRATPSTVWAHSFDLRVEYDPLSQETHPDRDVIYGDGTKDRYRWDAQAQVYQAPPGVHSTLEEVGAGFRLTTKPQMVFEFQEGSGGVRRLTVIRDPSGNEMTLAYASGRLATVTDASGRRISFLYGANCNPDPNCPQLCRIRDEFDGGEDIAREWQLLYDQCKLIVFQDPDGRNIGFGYDDDRHLTSLVDRNGKEWTFEFDEAGRIKAVNDPAPGTGRQVFNLYEDFGELRTEYTDRRGLIWNFHYSQFNVNLDRIVDPNQFSRYLGWDANRNLIWYSNEFASGPNDPQNTWTFQYDNRGNRTFATDPLGHKTAWTYDSLNNLTTVTPPLNDQGGLNTEKQVTIQYTDANHPASPTVIIEPADGEGNLIAETLLVYYDDDDAQGVCGANGAARWNGLLKSVTDPNGVTTTFEYDCFGLSRDFTEGGLGITGYRAWFVFDGGGRRIRSGVGDPPSSTTSQPSSSCFRCRVEPIRGECITGFLCICCQTTGGVVETTRELPSACAYPSIPPLVAGCTLLDWNGMAELQSITSCVQDPTIEDPPGPSGRSYDRDFSFAFNELGLPTQMSISTDEPTKDASGPMVQRTFGYDPDVLEGTWRRVGPDGQITDVETDELGRVRLVRRTIGTEVLDTVIEYDPDGRPWYVVYPNGMRTVYDYDRARRLKEIRHERLCNGNWTTALRLTYSLAPDGLIDGYTETDGGDDCSGSPVTSTVDFRYDHRDRLVEESRTGAHAYAVAYTYDQGGNRLTKTSGSTTVTYEYDLDDPGTNGSFNNRLMGYTIHQSGQPAEQVWYEYDGAGDPVRVIRHPVGTDDYAASVLYYDSAGRVWLVLDQQWSVEDGEPVNCRNTRLTEFRYDLTGRRRYLVRTRDPDTLQPHDDAVWTDYDDDERYGDYTVAGASGAAADLRGYEPGLWQREGSSGLTAVPLADQIGTMRQMTIGSGTKRRQVYTAFGEAVHAWESVPGLPATATRYQYAGDWGYETGLLAVGPEVLAPPSAGWQHVGERWYDPTTGRFLQRDPTGTAGGLNTYAYVDNSPQELVDPTGLQYVPSVKPPMGPPPLVGPWIRAPDTPDNPLLSPESGVYIRGNPCLLDCFTAPGCLGMGLRYCVDNRPFPRFNPTPPYFYCPACRRISGPMPHLHADRSRRRP